MELAELVGWLATGASTLSFSPQAWKIIRTRRTADISAGMYVLTVAGFSLWTVYGVMLGAWPLVATNAICLSLSGFILGMKLLPRGKRAKVADALDPSNQDARKAKRPL
jgi:MtN3 and saliva related transmembrane protein